MKTLNDMLDDAVKRGPDRTALVLLPSARGAERRLTFSELSKLILQAAAAFQSRDIQAGDRVAIMHRNGLGFIVAYFALARLGAAAVPVNFMVQKAEELEFMLGHCGAKGAVAQREFLDALSSVRGKLPRLQHVWITDPGETPLPSGAEDFWHFVEGHAPLSDSDAAGPAAPGSVACVLYTSGTTGRPKGVMLTHSNLLSNCEASIRAMGLNESDTMLCLLPMFHTFSWTICVLVPMRLGIRSVVAESVAPPAPWLRAMGKNGVTLFVGVPQIYALLARQASGLKRLLLRYWFFRSVRLCVCGAAPLNPATYELFRSALGREILQGYGLTETSPVATINRPGRARPESAGPALEGVEISIMDEAGRKLPSGQEGEICVRGPNVMKGYLDDPEATAAAVSPEGWLRTGDIGALDQDGFLYIRDRKKDMIIVKGLKVFSAQVEAVLASHPDVAEAAVVGIPDETGDETIKAFLVLKEGSGASKSDLLRFCREKLDPYKRPRDLEIVGELPKNALQKVLKRVLRQRELEKLR